MEEVESNNHGDPFRSLLPTATISLSLQEEPIQVQSFSRVEKGKRHKSDRLKRGKDINYQKPGKIAAYWQQRCRPWLNQEPSSSQAISGYGAPKPQTELQRTGMIKETSTTIVYKKVMETVANKTLGAFLEHYGDNLVHVKIQELWKSKMMNYEVAQVRAAAKVPTASIGTPLNDLNPPYKRMKQCRIGTPTQEKAHPLVLAPSQPTTATSSIPLQGKSSTHFRCLSAFRDCNGTISKSAANIKKLGKIALYEKQPRRPWMAANPGFEEAQPKSTLQYLGQVSFGKNSSNQVHTRV